MGANATSVAARVTSASSRIEFVKPLLSWFSALVGQPIGILAAIGAGALLAATPLLLRNDEQHRASAVADIAGAIDVLANLVAHEAAKLGPDTSRTRDSAEALIETLPTGAFSHGRLLLVIDEHDLIVASEPRNERSPRRLSDLLGGARPSSMTADRPWLLEVTMPDGVRWLATVRDIPGGHIAVLQPTTSADRPSWLPPIEHAGPPLALLLAVSVLGTGCHRQARRARAAHLSCARTNTRLETSLARGRCGLWDWDLARGEIFWSASMHELLGFEARAGSLSLAEVSAIVDWPDGGLERFSADLLRSGCRPVDREFRARTAAGQWLVMQVRGEVVPDPEHGNPHLVGIAVDVTDERSRAEHNAVADARLRDALEAISEAFVLWDADNRLILCNSKFQELYDLPPELAVPGASYREVIAAVRPSVVENRPAIGYPQHPNARTIAKQLSDGRWIQISDRRTRDGGFVSVGTDITSLKQKEEKLLGSERRLTASVRALKQSRKVLQIQAQRLAELAERNHDERARAESANHAKTEFLAKMSHELRTPLNAIIGFADMMRQEMLGPLGCGRYREYNNHIHKSGLKLLSVIDHILKMSQIETGRIRLALEPVALSDLAEEAFAAVEVDADEKDLTLTTDFDKAVIMLSVDAEALREVLIQLLRNAVKFTERGGSIRLRARRAGDALNIFVEDDGIGIPEEFVARLGRPFEQIEAEYSRSDSGSGLGLAIARGLTELHHGRLRIRSQEGVGTVALVHLPNTPLAANDGADDAVLGGLQSFQLMAAE